MRTPAQSTGDAAETAVAALLQGRGWTILARNIRVGRGEIDIVAIDPLPAATIVIVEVRWRRSRAFGLAEETIDHRKRAHLRTAIARLLADGLPSGGRLPRLPVRADLVVVEPPSSPGGAPRVRHHRSVAL